MPKDIQLARRILRIPPYDQPVVEAEPLPVVQPEPLPVVQPWVPMFGLAGFGSGMYTTVLNLDLVNVYSFRTPSSDQPEVEAEPLPLVQP